MKSKMPVRVNAGKKHKPHYYFFWIILIFVSVLTYVWEQIESERLGRRLMLLKKERQELINNHTKLQIKVNRLRSPERLDKIAKRKKFIIPDESQIRKIVINENN